MKKKPASIMKRINLEVTGPNVRFVDLVSGPLPYLWVGDAARCFGCVPDRHVEKLRDMCNEILGRRKIEG